MLKKVQRLLRKPPHVIVKRLHAEVRGQWCRYRYAKYRKQRCSKHLLSLSHERNYQDLWARLAMRPYASYVLDFNRAHYNKFCPQDEAYIVQKAEQVLLHQVDLLGSGLIDLGTKIDWHKDYKSGFDWPPQYFKDIAYNNPERPSDVKFPWEVSRMQWLIPAGQAFMLTQDDRYAQAVRDIIDDWIEQNPCGYSVNWACTMDVALRLITWTWLFHVFHQAPSWQDERFQQRLLESLYQHGDFTSDHLEFSDVNGNHYTADAAGLVFAGLFFGDIGQGEQWQESGWQILNSELDKQIYPDGVDFEASIPYHRLVLELFLLPAIYRRALSLPIEKTYQDTLNRMAEFSVYYSRSNGTVPLMGDADDARTLPFGLQTINDHLYLSSLVGVLTENEFLLTQHQGPFSECYWTFGPQACQRVLELQAKHSILTSKAFEQGGFFIMRDAKNHITIDCGPVGLAGRGGHGHNDCLSFEAMLDGELLISDCGAYLYTADYEARNRFRSTAMHNTPQVDGEEINRFIAWDNLWNVHYDAKPNLIQWHSDDTQTLFCGSHEGYLRLPHPVKLQRSMVLHHDQASLTMTDSFESQGSHDYQIPLHLATGVEVESYNEQSFRLKSGDKSFLLSWHGVQGWQPKVSPTHISPSYGVIQESQKIEWTLNKAMNAQLSLSITKI